MVLAFLVLVPLASSPAVASARSRAAVARELRHAPVPVVAAIDRALERRRQARVRRALALRVAQRRSALVHAARSYLGVRYAWAGSSRAGVDCSGLTMVAFRAVGIGLPHQSGAQFQLGRRVARRGLQPGDLVFFGSGSPSHVGLYIGRNRMIHSPRSGETVRVQSMATRWDDFLGAVRLIG